MARAYTKGQKLAQKRQRALEAAGFPELSPIPRRESTGRVSRKGKTIDPSVEAMKVRCRQRGAEVTDEAIRESRSPWWGCSAGTAMANAVTVHDERAELWDAIQHIRRVVTAHDAAIGAPRRHAVCLRLLAPTEALEADAESPPADDRSEADKQRAATSALMRVEGWLGWTDSAAASECKRVVLDDARVRSVPGLLSALRCVSDGLKGRKQVYRGLRSIN